MSTKKNELNDLKIKVYRLKNDELSLNLPVSMHPMHQMQTVNNLMEWVSQMKGNQISRAACIVTFFVAKITSYAEILKAVEDRLGHQRILLTYYLGYF